MSRVFQSQKVYCDRLVAVRWLLVYHNKSAKFGMWDQGIDDPATMASCQDRSGLVMAAVEAKHLITRRTAIMASCTAADYLEHRWIRAVAAPKRAPIPVHIQGAVQGMTLLTRDYKFHCYLDGRIFREPMTERSTNHA